MGVYISKSNCSIIARRLEGGTRVQYGWSEYGGEHRFYTNDPDDLPHWLGKSEREIFSKLCFMDCGYFYDLDNTWYYIIPGAFQIKIPLAYFDYHLDKDLREFEERKRIEQFVLEHLLNEYYNTNPDFQSLIQEKYPQGIEEIREDVLIANEYDHGYYFKDKYHALYDYFDDWVVIESSNKIDITGIIVRKKQADQGRNRIETIDWRHD